MNPYLALVVAVAIFYLAYRLGEFVENSRHLKPHERRPGDWWDA
jgi:hypothetical protein